ncbi:MAG TPA: bL28 family ribosomal protein [Candidatus Paceibacterota bacterium]|nr:bL28 family ribosomal protein [Candidatus Paceibacterota bacterium]
MAKQCVITGKSSIGGGRYSNRVRATQYNPGVKRGKVRKMSNLQTRTLFVPELGKNVRVTISARGMKTVRKNGAYAALKKAGAIK